MATRKQITKTWTEIEVIRQDLIGNIFPSIKQTKEELDIFHRKMLEGSAEGESVQDKINNLDRSHQTIGNYFLIKDFSYVYKELLN